jgi:hypothetical protein
MEADERTVKAAIYGLIAPVGGRGNWKKRGSFTPWCVRMA